MAEKRGGNIIRLKKVEKKEISSLLKPRAAKALDLLCDAVSSSAVTPSGLEEAEIVHSIKKLKYASCDYYYYKLYGTVTPVWNISTKEELDEVGLNHHEIEGLTSILPWYGESSPKSLNEDSDKLIPEILLTLKTLDFEEDGFRQLVSDLQFYPSVGILLCEILCDDKLLEKAQTFLDQESFDQKQEILFQYLNKKLQNFSGLSIIHFVQACGQHIARIVPGEIDQINIQYTNLSELDITALTRVICHSSLVKELTLRHCNLNDILVGLLHDGLDKSNVKIRRLVVSLNRDMNEDGFCILGKIVKKHEVEDLDMSDCRLTKEKLESFDKASGDAKIRRLDVSWNGDMNEEGFWSLGKIVKKHEVEDLDMSACLLTKGKLESFDKGSGYAKIRHLNVSLNRDMNEEGFCSLGEIVKKHEVEDLEMCNCGLTKKKLESFDKASGDAKIRRLDVSWNGDMNDEGFRSIGKIVKKHAVEDLDMSVCFLTKGKLESFDRGSGYAKIRRLDVSRNGDMNEEGFRNLGKIVKKHAVEDLDMSGCGLTKGKVQSFDNASGDAKIRHLNVSGNNDMNEEGFCSLGEIVKKHEVEDLDLSDCGLTKGKVESFDKASGDAKIAVLNISDFFGSRFTNVAWIPVTAICQLSLKITHLFLIENYDHKRYHWNFADILLLQDFIHNHHPRGLRVMVGKRLPELHSDFTSEDYFKQPAVISYFALQRDFNEISSAASYFSSKYRSSARDFDKASSAASYHSSGYGSAPSDLYGFDHHGKLKLEPIESRIRAYKKIFPELDWGQKSSPKSEKESSVTEEDKDSSKTKEQADQFILTESVKAQIEDAMTVLVGGCEISFPFKAFDAPQTVNMTLEIDSQKWPPGRSVITPSLYVDAKNLKKALTVKLPTWCLGVKNWSDSMVDVLRYVEDKNEWEIIHSLHFKNQKYLQFQCKHFSPIVAAFRKFVLYWAGLEPIVYRSTANFAVALNFNIEMYREAFLQKIKKTIGSEVQEIYLNVISCSGSEEIKSHLSCGGNFVIEPHSPYKHSVQKMLETGQPDYKLCNLIIEGPHPKEISIGYKLEINGNIDQEHCVTRKWGESRIEQTVPGDTATPSTVNVNAPVYGDLNLRSRGRTEDNRGLIAQTLNKGRMESDEKDCVNAMPVYSSNNRKTPADIEKNHPISTSLSFQYVISIILISYILYICFIKYS